MKTFIVGCIAVLLTFLLLDSIWLGLLAKETYVQAMQGRLRETYPVFPWVSFYLIYVFAINHLVVQPNLHQPYWRVILSGGTLGMAAYGAYNLTNYAIMADWPLSITLLDLGWGVCVTSMASLAGWHAVKRVCDVKTQHS